MKPLLPYLAALSLVGFLCYTLAFCKLVKTMKGFWLRMALGGLLAAVAVWQAITFLTVSHAHVLMIARVALSMMVSVIGIILYLTMSGHLKNGKH